MKDRAAYVSALVHHARGRLAALQHPDGVFCLEERAGDPSLHGRSPRYTLMCVLGASAAVLTGARPPFDIERTWAAVQGELHAPGVVPGDLGLALWADARLGGRLSEHLSGRLERALAAQPLPSLEGQEVAWITIGLLAGGRVESDALGRALGELARRGTAVGVLEHTGSGLRRRFPNFATQIYGILALSLAARILGDERAHEIARRVADRMLALARPDRGWPWLFDANRGGVVESYEVYAVHQDAMAPMALFELTTTTGDPRYAQAAIAGVDWMQGNELGLDMFDRDRGIVYRSVRRRAPLDRVALYANTAASLAGAHVFPPLPSAIELNPTDRPYHLGWVLEAWSGREASLTSGAQPADAARSFV